MDVINSFIMLFIYFALVALTLSMSSLSHENNGSRIPNLLHMLSRIRTNNVVNFETNKKKADSAETNIEEFGEEEVADNNAGEDEIDTEKVEEIEEDNSSVAVKFGVGVALVVVAHIVLVRKWRSGQQNNNKTAEEEMNVEMLRRNTMIPVSTPDQLEQEIQNAEDEYSEDELEEDSEEEIITPSHQYMQFQTDYSSPKSVENIVKQRMENIQNATPKVEYYYKNTDEQRQSAGNTEEEEEEEEEEGEEEVEEDEVEEIDEGDCEEHNVEVECEEIEEGHAEGDDVGDEYVKNEGDVEGDDAEEEDSDDISDVDDDELLKKLEARYGKLSNKMYNEEKYDFKKNPNLMTNIDRLTKTESDLKSDDMLRQKLKNAEKSLQDNTELALSLYTNLLSELPNNVKVKYGRARALDRLAEIKKSKEFFHDAFLSYYELLQDTTISDEIFAKTGMRCIELIRISGVYSRAVHVHKKLIDRFPNNSEYLNELAVTLLTSNRLTDAKFVLQKVLSRWPDNGFAQVHYGFILKVNDNDLFGAVEYLQAGIKSNAPGVIDGRFFFHLGDALTRLGRNSEATKIYEDGVKQKIFLSKYQRSFYNVNRLVAKPWWFINETPYTSFFKLLENNWKRIRVEGLALLNEENYFKEETENLRDKGNWGQFELFARGVKFSNNCKKCPETCKMIESLPDARNCKRGQVKFSVIHPGTHIWPHCGPSNCRLRAHLGLKVPPDTFIRVAEEIRSWEEGKVILFDDSFEHEVWHNGSDVRLVLIVDVWHPDLNESEKNSLLPI